MFAINIYTKINKAQSKIQQLAVLKYIYPSIFTNRNQSCSSNDPKGEYWKYKYNPCLQEAFNKQIQAEHQAAQDYLNIAVFYLHPKTYRPGIGCYFMDMHYEEMGHMHQFIEYQLLRGGKVILHSIQEPEVICNLNPLDAFKRALHMENAVSKMLEDLVVIAEKAKDYQAADFITSKCLSEQILSVNKIANHITELTRLSTEYSIYHYDLKLLESSSYKIKKPF